MSRLVAVGVRLAVALLALASAVSAAYDSTVVYGSGTTINPSAQIGAYTVLGANVVILENAGW